MKKVLICIILIIASSSLFAQRCYLVKSTKGAELYKQGRYSEARALFVEAKSCPDRPKSSKEMDSWIKLCDNKIKEQNNKAANNKTDQSPNSLKTTTPIQKKASTSTGYLSVSQNELAFTSEGGTKNIEVYCDAKWDINIPPANWVHITKNGNQIIINVDNNRLITDRNDYFVLKSGEKESRVDIMQNGAEPYISASSKSLHYKTEGGLQTINITSNCEWNVKITTASWIQLTRTGNNIQLSVKKNDTKKERSDYFVLTAGGKDIKITITQEYVKNHGFFIEEEEFANNFINFNGGYNIKQEEIYLGLSYSFIKSHIGFRISGYLGLDNKFNSYIATFDPVFRLTNDKSTLDLQLYIGGGIYDGNPIGDVGLRFAWKTHNNLSLWDFSLGCMGTLNGDIIPSIGLGIAIPFSPVIGISSWLSKSESFYDFSSHFIDVTRIINSNWGISYSYIQKRVGWYVSALFDNNNLGFVTGPVFRICSPTSEVDFHLYGGAGYYRNNLAYDVGIRIAPTPNKSFCWWDLTMGLTNIDNHNYVTIGGSLCVSAIVGIIAWGYENLDYQ